MKPKQTKDQVPPQELQKESPPAPDPRKELEALGLDHLLPQRPPERPDRRHRR